MTRIELDDAQLARVHGEGRRIALQLSTAPAWRPGEGADTRPVPGHLSGIALVFEDATATFDGGVAPGDCIGAVREARLRHDGQLVRDLPVPAEWTGAITLELTLRNGVGLQVRAQRMCARRADDSRFTESLAC